MGLVFYCLINNSFGTYRFQRPGAQHRARWMSSAIYALKMLLLQTQHYVDAKILKELFGCFVAAIDAKHWFKAPVGAETAANDLPSYKLLLAHQPYQYLKTYLMLLSQH